MVTKKGFTLPEVIITLCILGVLAAILVPAITKASPDGNKVMLKKAYSTVEQTVSELINDDVNYPSTAHFGDSYSSIQKGFAYKETVSNPTIPVGTEKFCYLFTQKLNTIGNVTCGADGELQTG